MAVLAGAALTLALAALVPAPACAVPRGWRKVFSWGDNRFGEGGRGTLPFAQDVPLPSSCAPMEVEELSWGVLENAPGTQIDRVVAGLDHAFALSAEGRVWAWGRNNLGQLGLGYRSSEDVYVATPTELTTLGGRKIVDAAAGVDHSLLLDAEGNVHAFGSNFKGQLGLAVWDDLAQFSGCDDEACTVPKRVEIPEGVANVTAGGAHSAALTVTGRVYTWGYNREGQLGLDDVEDRNAPLRVSAGAFEAVRCKLLAAGGHASGGDGGNRTVDGGHTVCVSVDDTIWSWGDNFHGQLGKQQTYLRVCPTCDTYTPNTMDNVTKRWFNRHPTPQKVGHLGEGNATEDIKELVVGSHHTVALTRSGQIWAWGDNNFGQLGLGYAWRERDPNTRQINDRPRRIEHFDYNVTLDDAGANVSVIEYKEFVHIDAAKFQTVALDANGDVYTWGTNSHGELGECPCVYDDDEEKYHCGLDYLPSEYWRTEPKRVNLLNHSLAAVAAGGSLFAISYNTCPDDPFGEACSKNGECLEKTNECECDFEWRGQICEKMCPMPDGEVCFGHGTCLETPTGTTCSCEEGYFGRGCDLVCPQDELGRFCSNNGTCVIDAEINDGLPYCVCTRFCVHPSKCVELGVPREMHDFERAECLARDLLPRGLWCSYYGPLGYEACYNDGMCGTCENDATGQSPVTRRAAAAAAVGAGAAAIATLSSEEGPIGDFHLLGRHVQYMFAGFSKTKISWGNRRSTSVGLSCCFLLAPALPALLSGCESHRWMAPMWAVTTVASLGSDYFYAGVDSAWHGVDRWIAPSTLACSVAFTARALHRALGSVALAAVATVALLTVPITCFVNSTRSHQRGLGRWKQYVVWHTIWHLTAGGIMTAVYSLTPCFEAKT